MDDHICEGIGMKNAQRTYCGDRDRGCGAKITPADLEAGFCTQCGEPLVPSVFPATPGPWRAVALLTDAENHHVLAGEFSDRHIKATADDGNGLIAFADLPANTEFIAAFNPTTCLALLEEVERLRQALKGAKDDSDAAAIESRWRSSQGEDYGSY